jgi:uncharacterized membrane protein YfcA
MALYGQVSASLMLGAGVTLLPIPRRRRVGSIIALLAFFTLAPFLYGLTGPLSFTLTQIALLRICNLDHVVMKGTSAGLLVAFAAVFYPLAFGAGPFDPFDLGYRPLPLLVLMVPVGIILAWRGQHVWLLILGFDLSAYGLGLFENLWSAFFDPILVLLAAIQLTPRRLNRRKEVDA